jgi:hypothetical protein
MTLRKRKPGLICVSTGQWDTGYAHRLLHAAPAPLSAVKEQESKMEHAGVQLGRDPAFGRFLGAAVGDDRNGASVTVLSMLARLGLDPWDEASVLTSMPEAPARSRLEALLDRFKDVPMEVSARSSLALGLLAFLPRRENAARLSTKPALSPPRFPRFGGTVYWIVAIVLFAGWVSMLANGN